MDSFVLLQEELTADGIHWLANHSLAQHTSFQIGGPARLYCCPDNQKQLAKILSFCKAHQQKYYLLGNGSNTLFSDMGFDGVVISTRGLAQLTSMEGNRIFCQAGAQLLSACRLAANNGLSGLEFACGIPGSVGGAVYMNAGAYGGEMRDVLESVTFLDETGQEQALSVDEMALGYRTSIFQQKQWVILSIVMKLVPGNIEDISAKMNGNLASRREKQPLEYPSAGSTFKRPQGAFAGALIEQCGLRGFQVGGAAVSTKHCGFVINLGGATCADVVSLCEQVRKAVKEKTGYELEREIKIVE